MVTTLNAAIVHLGAFATDPVRAVAGLSSHILLAAPTPAPQPFNPPATAPPGIANLSNMLFGWAKWILIAAGVLGLMICAGQMVIGRRNRSATAVDGATGIPWVLAGLTLASLAAGIVTTVLT